MECAQQCYSSSNCGQGWANQISTKKCFFYDTLNLTQLKPDSLSSEEDLGWATGLKSCTDSGLISPNCYQFPLIAINFP